VSHIDPQPEHSKSCYRCALVDQANELDISIYEKPLSSNPAVAKATIFELKAPETFTHWRDATYYFVTTILGIREDSPKKPSYSFDLDKHQDLAQYLPDRHQARRIVIVSTAKSNTSKSVPLKVSSTLEEADVCLENGLKYIYFDKLQNTLIDGTRKHTGELPKKCSYELSGLSKPLNRYLCRPWSATDGLPNNEVIADQSECPPHFAVDEFKTFCSIPFGCEIMYKNILLQLAAPGIDFAKTETQYLLQQIVHQAGPPNGQAERTLHLILRDEGFCSSILEQLEVALQRISTNWESCRALATFCLLARRVLSLSCSDTIAERSLEYLANVRQICSEWLRTLEDRAVSSTDYEQRSELYLRTLDIALLSTSTFDIDETFFQDILAQPDAVVTLLQCSIKVKENQESLKSDKDGVCTIMYQSWRRLMHRILPTLQQHILRNSASDSLSQAVLMSWSTFQSTSQAQWSAMPEPQHQWLHTTSGTLSVHFDLLTGNLLVNGLPLTRLPSQFTQHKMYERLFGKTILEVGPSDEAGMQFSAKSTRHDYKLHFGLKDGDMLLLATKEMSR